MTGTAQTPNGHHSEPIPFDERSRRVAELARQVKAGLYRPDERDVARAILAHWFEVGMEVAREEAVGARPAQRDRGLASRFLVERTAQVVDEGSARTA